MMAMMEIRMAAVFDIWLIAVLPQSCNHGRFGLRSGLHADDPLRNPVFAAHSSPMEHAPVGYGGWPWMVSELFASLKRFADSCNACRGGITTT
ncbi:MAG: hypothetical protein EGP85_13110 [Bifidobacterium bifidum]|nr:hypothetical protein [Bifidobacterium bifidum]